jgi:type I restriction enzyme M protein
MNLAIRGIDPQISHGDTFHNDRHPDLKADCVLANTATATPRSDKAV